MSKHIALEVSKKSKTLGLTKDEHICILALKDSWVQSQVSDDLEHDWVVAELMGGRPVSVRTKGHLFRIEPVEFQKQLQHQTYFEGAIWQLKAAEVE
jgi:hypothetical protein